jgi:hypothetical protein
VYAYARLHYRMPKALARIASKIGALAPAARPQDAAMAAWGFAKLGFRPGPGLLDRLPAGLLDHLDDFRPQEAAMLLYGYGLLRHAHPGLLDAAARALPRRLPEFSTQEVVMVLWAYGALCHCPTPPAVAGLFDEACAQLLARRRRLLPCHIAVTLKALARAGHAPPAEFMDAMGRAALERLPAFKPVELCHLLWAYARLGYRDVALTEGVVGRAVALLQAPASPALPKLTVDTIVWAAQHVGFWPQALIDTAEMRGIYVKTAHGGRHATAATGAGPGGPWAGAGGDEGGGGSPLELGPDSSLGSSSGGGGGAGVGRDTLNGTGSFIDGSLATTSSRSSSSSNGTAGTTGPRRQQSQKQQQQQQHSQQRWHSPPHGGGRGGGDGAAPRAPSSRAPRAPLVLEQRPRAALQQGVGAADYLQHQQQQQRSSVDGPVEPHNGAAASHPAHPQRPSPPLPRQQPPPLRRRPPPLLAEPAAPASIRAGLAQPGAHAWQALPLEVVPGAADPL